MNRGLPDEAAPAVAASNGMYDMPGWSNLTMAILAAAALGLAGCGGSGGGGGSASGNTAADMERAQLVADALEAARATRADGTFRDAHRFAPKVTGAHDGGSVRISVTESGGSRTGAFEEADRPTRITGWTGARFGRGEDEELVVYADMGAPEAAPFTPGNLNKLREVSGLGGETVPASGLAIETGYWPVIRSTSLAAAPANGSVTHNAQGTGADAGLVFDGTFAGGRGEYRCTGSTCAVTLDDGGVATEMIGAWIFDPADGAMVLFPDYAHVHFGWWLNETDDGAFRFQSFAGAEALPAGTVTAEMQGSATYRGAAAGVWTTEEVSGGRVTAARSGAFTAEATLTAHFFGPRDEGDIRGTIVSFRNAAGRPMPGWSVTLKETGLTAGRAGFAGETAGTIGAGTSGTGSWEGRFHGTDGAETAPRPSDVTGRFDVHFPGAHVAGAFGGSR